MTAQPALSAARRSVGLARHVPAAAVSVCLALVLCSGIVTALVLPVASDSTSVLRHPVAVTVTPAGGSAAAAHDGQVLNPGDVINVGRAGSGEVVTGARKLWLGGAGTQVRVDGPASTEIRRGSVVAEDPGRPWSLQADQVTVSGVTGAVRIDYGFTTRVADYAGRAQLTVPTGASATLSGLDQVEASGSILNGSDYPLKLDDDALDTAAAPALVTLDRGLIALASQVDADPVVLASSHSSAENPSERLLPVAIAAAGSGGTDAQRTQTALAARQLQGSWGVIAEGAHATLSGVRSDLAMLLDTSPKQAAALAAAVAQTAPVATASPSSRSAKKLASAAPQPAASTAPKASHPRPSATPRASAAASSRPAPSASAAVPVRASATATPSATPTAAPSPSPSPTPLVNVLLNTVGGLLGSPSPTPSAQPRGADASPAAAPTPLLTGVLKGVGGL